MHAPGLIPKIFMDVNDKSSKFTCYELLVLCCGNGKKKDHSLREQIQPFPRSSILISLEETE